MLQVFFLKTLQKKFHIIFIHLLCESEKYTLEVFL